MAWTTPGTATAGSVLTASFWNTQVRDNLNQLGRGAIAFVNSTTSVASTATHTNYKDDSISVSVAYETGRRYLITLRIYPYTDGGVQAMRYQLLRTSTTVAEWPLSANVMSATEASAVTLSAVFAPASTATETFKVQFRAVSANTQVTSYADSTWSKQLSIIDIGLA